MKAPPFDYAKPLTLDHALALLADTTRDARPLAGGQSLVPMLNFRLAAPDVLVDLSGIADLAGITESADAITIGAMTRYRDLARSEAVTRALPLVAAALPHIAHPAIRNRGTIGGSLALADPAAELPAVALALDATLIAVSPAGRREIAAADFFRGVYETALAPGEILEAVRFPRAAADARFAFDELARRHGDYAMAGVAVAARGREALSDVRVALFSVADRPVRARAAEAALEGRDPHDPQARAAAAEALDEIAFEGDLNAAPQTKRHLARVLLGRVLARL